MNSRFSHLSGLVLLPSQSASPRIHPSRLSWEGEGKRNQTSLVAPLGTLKMRPPPCLESEEIPWLSCQFSFQPRPCYTGFEIYHCHHIPYWNKKKNKERFTTKKEPRKQSKGKSRLLYTLTLVLQCFLKLHRYTLPYPSLPSR